MPSKRTFEEQIAKLDELRQLSAEDRVEPLRLALTKRNNFVVAKAADLVREGGMRQLTPDLLEAFDRFFENPGKTDPQCWAKNALARTLAAFEYQEPEPFLRGMRHSQLEPVWGGRSDTAGTLRSISALALVQCRSISNHDVLVHLVDLLCDEDKSVRAEIMRAIEQVGSPAASLLLRAKALTGDREPEVLGACYSGILRLEGVRAISWVEQFLSRADDASSEAALAIAETRSIEGFHSLKDALEQAHDNAARSLLLSAITLCRQEAAYQFLLHQIASESLLATGAIDAILRAAPPEIIARAETAVASSPMLSRYLAAQRKSSS